jgi:hypothetical protein
MLEASLNHLAEAVRGGWLGAQEQDARSSAAGGLTLT